MAEGISRKNPQFGPGGGEQFFIENRDKTKLIDTKIQFPLKMKKISFNTKTGYILLDNIAIAPIGEIEFIEKSLKYKIEIITNQTNTHIHIFSTFGTLNEFEFGVNFIFESFLIKNIWLFWDGGNSKNTGTTPQKTN